MKNLVLGNMAEPLNQQPRSCPASALLLCKILNAFVVHATGLTVLDLVVYSWTHPTQDARL